MKKFLLGFVVLLFAAGFAAFTTPGQVKTFDHTYQYTGSTVAGENTAANYTLQASPDCDDTDPEMVCFIETSYAPDVNNHPSFPGGTLPVRSSNQVIIKDYKPIP